MSMPTLIVPSRTEIAREIATRTIGGGIKWGTIGGTVFGTLVFPIIGSIIGAVLGMMIGCVIGCLLAITLSGLTACLHYPLGDKRAYAWNSYVSSVATTFLSAFPIFFIIFSEHNFRFSLIASFAPEYNLNLYLSTLIAVVTTCLLARKLIAWYSSLLFMKYPSPRHSLIQRWSVPLISVAATTLIAGMLFGLPFSL